MPNNSSTSRARTALIKPGQTTRQLFLQRRLGPIYTTKALLVSLPWPDLTPTKPGMACGVVVDLDDYWQPRCMISAPIRYDDDFSDPVGSRCPTHVVTHLGFLGPINKLRSKPRIGAAA